MLVEIFYSDLIFINKFYLFIFLFDEYILWYKDKFKNKLNLEFIWMLKYIYIIKMFVSVSMILGCVLVWSYVMFF